MFDFIADIRKEYILKTLSESDAEDNPIAQFEKWWKEAVHSEIIEPNAMTLATSSSDGLPAARIVLLKGFDQKCFVFYTNYNSFKGQQLAENPRACLVFFWKEIERQVRITGIVSKVNPASSDEYFHSRPSLSRFGAVASPQSQVIESREWLELRVEKLTEDLGSEDPKRPEHWGGYIVRPVTIEFWQGRSNRLHDRLQYSLEEGGGWKIERLAP
ncbi:MAG TPA: pyridoxamine 5'-phosphate oxidase [Flavitalea sp.]|nr:pyridoxamine 5'-phosphate oxidase [Flavitalea sp.]